MKRLITIMIFFITTVCFASVQFSPDKTYQIQCKMWNSGSLQTGKSHGNNIPLFYDLSNTSNADAYWYLTEEETGKFSIKNASTGQYMTYDGERNDYKRYVDLTDNMQGEASLWQINEYENGYYTIACCLNGHFLDVRTSSYIVGTYEQNGTPGQNEIFKFTEKGELSTDISNYIDTLYINGKQAIYNITDRSFLLPIKENYINEKTFTGKAKVIYKKGNSNIKLTINDQDLNSNIQFQDFTEGNIFLLKIKDEQDNILAKANLSFTFLPIVEITGYGFNNYNYTNGTIKVNDPNTSAIDTIAQAQFRYRGATASTMNKKAYAVKLINKEQESMDASYFGLREDNNWILDAMAIDPGRMRNRISTDLWNDYATKPYHFTEEPEAQNGTRGVFVELFLNGEYAGIYCMTEKLDRKQLKLKKQKESETPGQSAIIRGLLYKSSQWSYSVLMGHNIDQNYFPMTPVAGYNNNSETWDGWEMQYPDLNDGEIIDWGPLANAINIVATASNTDFPKEVYNYFDIPVLLDYYLFIELILATDNHGKNMFLHCYNIQDAPKLSISPWDLDGTWGRRWNGSNNITSDATQDFVTFLWNYEHGELTLFKRLAELNVGYWNEKLAARYATLRLSFFDHDKLLKRFTQTYELFKASGADQREIQRWNGSNGVQLDFEQEMDYLDRWIEERIQTLDKQYGYDPTTGCSDPVYTNKPIISAASGQIIVKCSEPIMIYIHNADGTLINQRRINSGMTSIPIGKPGLYIVNGEKVILK